MAASAFLAQAAAAQSISANGASSIIAMNQVFNSVQAEIQITSAPTGTSPTLVVQLQGSLDGVNFFNIGSATSALSSTGLTLLNVSNVSVPWIKLTYTVGGTTPVFPSVTINVYVS